MIWKKACPGLDPERAPVSDTIMLE